jgi:hypothetical protein
VGGYSGTPARRFKVRHRKLIGWLTRFLGFYLLDAARRFGAITLAAGGRKSRLDMPGMSQLAPSIPPGSHEERGPAPSCHQGMEQTAHAGTARGLSCSKRSTAVRGCPRMSTPVGTQLVTQSAWAFNGHAASHGSGLE